MLLFFVYLSLFMVNDKTGDYVYTYYKNNNTSNLPE